MPVSTPLYLLLTALAAGIGLALALVPPAATSRGYGQTMAAVALGVLMAALAYDAWFRFGPEARLGLDGGVGSAAAAAQVGAAVALAVLLLRLRDGALPGRALPVAVALLSGAGVAIVSVLVMPAGAGTALKLLSAVDGLAGAAVLGLGMSAMLLGHFYLMVPGLSIDPFMTLSKGFVAAVVVRVLLGGIALGVTGVEAVWPADAALGVDPITPILFGVVPLVMRVLFGLVGALVLGIMTVQTVAIRSTQSATGILYAAVVFVLIGEFASGYLLIATGVPL